MTRTLTGKLIGTDEIPSRKALVKTLSETYKKFVIVKFTKVSDCDMFEYKVNIKL